MNYFIRFTSQSSNLTGTAVVAALASVANANLLTDTEQMQIGTLTSDLSGLQSEINTINQLLASDEVSLNNLQEVVDFIQANRDDLNNLSIANIPGLQNALDNAGSGLVETVIASSGVMIKHDGSGPTPPTFVDNNGVGTLVSNGNTISSVSGDLNASGGVYEFNHDNPSGVVGATQYGPNGFPVPGSSPRRISATQIDWLGLTGDSLHSFIWTF